jgi:diguanylate cyclase (GGDEF)-like protein/PAS domain S-box-containing protein
VRQYRPHFLVMAVLGITLFGGWHARLQTVLTDLRMKWTSRAASGDIVLVAIDPASLEKIGVWPWPRSLHARLIDQLEKAGTGDIVFDVDFSAASDPASDTAFADALRAAGGSVVLPTFRQTARADQNGAATYINQPLPQFAAQSWTAAVNVAIDGDGLVHRYPFFERIGGAALPSMSAMLAGQTDTNRPPFLIDFGIRAASVPVVSYIDVLNGAPEALARIAGKKVVIGGTALELGDRFSVPNGAVLPGPLLQILAAESIAQNRALYLSSDIMTLIGLVGLALIMLATWRLATGRKVVLLLALIVMTEMAATLLQKFFPVVLDTALFYTTIASYLIAIALDEIDFRGLLTRIAEKRFQGVAMSIGDGLICVDPRLTITMWNPGAEAIFGYRPDEMIGCSFESLCGRRTDGLSSFAIQALSPDELQIPGGVVQEFDGLSKNGEHLILEGCFSGWFGTDGFHYGISLRDISLRKREAERNRYLAEHDPITDLPNRSILQQRLLDVMDSSASGRKAALLVVSLNKFQHANVMLGHDFGERMLRVAGERLRASVSAPGLVARLDGDEFAVLMETADRNAAASCASTCAMAFAQPLRVGDREHQVNLSIGLVMLPDDATGVDEAIGNAHLALYRASSLNSSISVFYQPAFRDDLQTRLSIEAELVRALAHREFELFYQPQISLRDGRVIGAEALIRWHHPSRGLVPPIEFMPIANASMISNQLAAWVLYTACQQGARWMGQGHNLRIGVNLSPSQFSSATDLADDVAVVLASTGLPAELLELEVTEDILLEDAPRVLSTFRQIQDMGVRLVFDDFGTGYGSLSYLKTFPLDGLKIDRSFVTNLASSPADASIVRSTIDLSTELGLSVIAEGIEDRATADLLAQMGCSEGQGYYFGRPVSAADFTTRVLTADRSLSLASMAL